MRPTDVLYQLYGGKRGDEVLDTIGKWTRGMSEFKRDRPVSKSNRIEDYDYNTKAATTTDDGSGGFLVPEQVREQVCRVMHNYGKLLPLCSQVTVPAGAKVGVNELTTAPSVSYRGTQCTTIKPAVIAVRDPLMSLRPEFVGALLEASNEIVGNPGFNFSEFIFNTLVHEIVGAQERMILSGAKGVDAGHDGVLVDAAVIDMTGIDFSVAGAFASFITEAIQNNDALSNMDQSVLVAPPWIVPTQVGVNGLSCGPVGGNPRFLCYPLIPHLHSEKGPWFVSMFYGPHVVYATDGAITMDINPYANFNDNCSIIKVGQHFDFVLCHPELMARATVTVAP